MAVRFAIRGNNLTPRYTLDDNPNLLVNSSGGSPVGLVSDAGYLGGSYIDAYRASGWAGITWPVFNSIPNAPISVLFRGAPGYSGTAGNNALWCIQSAIHNVFMALYHTSGGDLRLLIYNNGAQIVFNDIVQASWSPTADTEYDMVVSWDGTTDPGGLKVFIDNVSLGTFNTLAAATGFQGFLGLLQVGSSAYSITSRWRMSEFLIDDTVIDPSNVTLEDNSTGALDGESRTQYVKADNFNGLLYDTVPNDRVQAGYSYIAAGITEVGTLESTRVVTDAIKATVVVPTITGEVR